MSAQMATSRKRRRSGSVDGKCDERMSEFSIRAIVDVIVDVERESDKPIFDEVSIDSETPYSDLMKIRGMNEENRVKRPLNTFMVFAHYMRSKVRSHNDKLNNAVVSKRLGEIWKTYSPSERQPFIDEANRLKSLHAKQYPDYRYRPKRRVSDVVSVEERAREAEKVRKRRRKSAVGRCEHRRRRRSSCCSSASSSSRSSYCESRRCERSREASGHRSRHSTVTQSASAASECDSGRFTLSDSVPRSVSSDAWDIDERERHSHVLSSQSPSQRSSADHTGSCKRVRYGSLQQPKSSTLMAARVDQNGNPTGVENFLMMRPEARSDHAQDNHGKNLLNCDSLDLNALASAEPHVLVPASLLARSAACSLLSAGRDAPLSRLFVFVPIGQACNLAPCVTTAGSAIGCRNPSDTYCNPLTQFSLESAPFLAPCTVQSPMDLFSQQTTLFDSLCAASAQGNPSVAHNTSFNQQDLDFEDFFAEPSGEDLQSCPDVPCKRPCADSSGLLGSTSDPVCIDEPFEASCPSHGSETPLRQSCDTPRLLVN